MPNRSVKNVLQKSKPVFASPEQSTFDVATAMKNNHESAALVVKNNKTVGIVTEYDLINRIILAQEDAKSVPVKNIMTSHTVIIRSGASFGQVLYLMHEFSINHIPVVDDGHPIGVVSKSDALFADVKEYASEAEMLDHITEVL